MTLDRVGCLAHFWHMVVPLRGGLSQSKEDKEHTCYPQVHLVKLNLQRQNQFISIFLQWQSATTRPSKIISWHLCCCTSLRNESEVSKVILKIRLKKISQFWSLEVSNAVRKWFTCNTSDWGLLLLWNLKTCCISPHHNLYKPLLSLHLKNLKTVKGTKSLLV